MGGGRKFRLHDGRKGAAIAVRVTPRSSRNEILTVMDDGTLKVCLTAPPVEGKANQALLNFMADVLGVPPSQLEIISGRSGRDKLVTVIGMDSASVQERIIAHMR